MTIAYLMVVIFPVILTQLIKNFWLCIAFCVRFYFSLKQSTLCDFFLFLFSNSGSIEVLGTEGQVKIIKFYFLSLFSLFLELSIFSSGFE